MKINVLISTLDKGIENVSNIILPFRNDVSYIVSHQFTSIEYKSIPNNLVRKDVKIFQFEGKGLSQSRNNAIEHADGDICVIADDDVKYKDEYLDKIKKTFYDNKVDVACFKIKTYKGEKEYKKYSEHSFQIILKRRPTISSIEIVFRLNRIRESKIKFDTRFGLGSNFLIGGEEQVFIADCLKNKMKVYFFPYYIVEHPYESSIKKLSRYHRDRNLTNGAIDMRINGLNSVLRAFVYVIRNVTELKKENKKISSYLFERLNGVIYIAKLNIIKILKD